MQYLKDGNDDGEGDLIDGYIERVVVFTDVEENSATQFSELVRIKDVAELSRKIPPKGVALPYFGSVTDINPGWQLCDGTNGTPDLSGQFVVGYDPGDSDYNEVAKSGGMKTVTLTENQMPKHKHYGTTGFGGSHTHTGTAVGPYTGSNISGGFKGGGNSFKNRSITINTSGSHTHSFTTDEKGKSKPHENRPPYFVLAYIAYVG